MKLSSSVAIGSIAVALSTHKAAAAANESDSQPLLALNSDESFHFQLVGTLGAAISSGADIGPVLGAAKHIVAGDMDSFSHQLYLLANHTKAQAQDMDANYDPINVKDTWLSASAYFRAADFYGHGDWNDPLITHLWNEQTAAFDKGIAALPIPGERVRIPAANGNFTVEAIWYGASDDRLAKLPTLIIGGGYDAAQEDSFHTYVVPALARGWNCITYEGPGQPTVRRNQQLGFIPDWERVVTPVVDYVLSEKASAVDESQLVLIGNSMGGYLAARAAAFEPRLSAVVLNGGIWSVQSAYMGQLSPEALDVFEAGNQTQFDDMIFELVDSGDVPTTISWGVEHGLWAFHTHSPFDFFAQTEKYTVEGIVDRINMPVWIADAEHEGFFPGQPQLVKDALGDKATLQPFTGVAGFHCQSGAFQELNRVLFAWLHKTLGASRV